MPSPGFSLLLVTDRHAVPAVREDARRSLVATISSALGAAPPGSVAVMVREKDLSGKELLDLCLSLREVCDSAGAFLLVNERADVARAAGAAGVHLPAAGLPPRAARMILGEEALIGVSTHGVRDVEEAAAGGADYVTFGPIYDTPSKRAYGAPVGMGPLEDAVGIRNERGEALAIFGLGGISTPEQAQEVLERGASGVACIRAVLAADDPAGAVRAFLFGRS